MRSVDSVVRSVLGYHLNRDVRAIATTDNLYRDLRLTTLGLVLVIMDMEDVAHIRVPIEELASVKTVGDLMSFVSEAVVVERRSAAAVERRSAAAKLGRRPIRGAA